MRSRKKSERMERITMTTSAQSQTQTPNPRFGARITIKLGIPGLMTVQDFLADYERSGIMVSEWGLRLLGTLNGHELAIAPTGTEVDLLEAYVAEFGFDGKYPRKQVYEHIFSLGYSSCSIETSLQLRRQWIVQFMGKISQVVSQQTILDPKDNEACGFGLDKNKKGILYLFGQPEGPKELLEPDDKLIVVIPRPVEISA